MAIQQQDCPLWLRRGPSKYAALHLLSSSTLIASVSFKGTHIKSQTEHEIFKKSTQQEFYLSDSNL